MSGEALGLDVDLDVAMDAARTGDAGVPDGDVLLAFASATNARSDELSAARAAVRAAVGGDGLKEAAATVAVFNGLVRVADGTGIQLDPNLLTASAESRDRLGIDGFAGAANSTDAESGDREFGSIAELFA